MNTLRATVQRGVRRSDVVVTLVGLLALLLWEFSGWDLLLSHAYGNHRGFVWRDDWFARGLLHDGGRALAWGVMALLLADAWRALLRGPPRAERWYWVAVTLACVLLVPTLKRLAYSSCPWDLLEFGGLTPYVPHWQLGAHDGGPGHCFPSGHAVAAFAFLSLYFGWRDHRPRLARAALVVVCIAGALYGWAQLARGAHFASHTLWSAWLCWLVCTMAVLWRQLHQPVAPNRLSDLSGV